MLDDKLPPPEIIRRLLFNLTIECIPFTPDEYTYVISQLGDKDVRQQLSDFLQDFTSPRNLDSEECLSMLGKICRTVLDILWADKENNSLRELNQIMHASQLLFIFKQESI